MLTTHPLNMKKTIYIYEKNALALEFLRGFFKSNHSYSAEFFTNIKKLNKNIKTSAPYALIAGTPE